MASPTNWRFSGDYFENCNCDVVCPCLASLRAPLTARPSQGVCDLALFFHIDRGSYGELSLDGLNVAVIAHWPGPMADGNGTLAAYIDERAGDRQTAALGAIFGGHGGRPDGRLCAPRGRQSRCKEGADQLRDRRQIPFGGNPRHPPHGRGTPADDASERRDLDRARASDRAGQARPSCGQPEQHIRGPRHALGQLWQKRPLRTDQLVGLVGSVLAKSGRYQLATCVAAPEPAGVR